MASTINIFTNLKHYFDLIYDRPSFPLDHIDCRRNWLEQVDNELDWSCTIFQLDEALVWIIELGTYITGRAASLFTFILNEIKFNMYFNPQMMFLIVIYQSESILTARLAA